MKELLRQKFNQQPFKQKLMQTIKAHIEEGNYWHDNFWGNCLCPKCKDIPGENNLGKAIMEIRSELFEKDSCHG